MLGRHVGGLAAIAAMAVAVTAQASAAGVTVLAYPSAQTITASGSLPAGGASRLDLGAAIGGDVDGVVVVAGAKRVAARLDRGSLRSLRVQLRFAHFVAFGSSRIPDALLPWDGSDRPAEQTNQPLWVQVSVPPGTAAGSYAGTLTVTADGQAVALPLAVTVFSVRLPVRGATSGSLVAAFNVGPEAYVNKAASLYQFKTGGEFIQFTQANDTLFDFLSTYGITPLSWGYGNPKSPVGYESSDRWWLDSASNMTAEVGTSRFGALWVPVSNNRASASTAIAHLVATSPERWCGYLTAVRKFWLAHGWLRSGVVPFVYGYDEPAAPQVSLLGRQATTVHRCFSGAKMMVTANPSPTGENKRLFDGKGSDDVDIWAVVNWRYYGKYTTPSQRKKKVDNSTYYSRVIADAKAHGKQIWAYTYYGVPVGPSFRATEPLSNPRMFLLWTALEGIGGVLYAEGMTTYGSGNPLQSVDSGGEAVLVYPGPDSPIPSARLEQLRAGIQDWAIFDIVRRRFGAGKVRSILGAHGLFSASSSGVKLACSIGCALKGSSPLAWPTWSHDGSTAGQIEAARLDALKAASG